MTPMKQTSLRKRRSVSANPSQAQARQTGATAPVMLAPRDFGDALGRLSRFLCDDDPAQVFSHSFTHTSVDEHLVVRVLADSLHQTESLDLLLVEPPILTTWRSQRQRIAVAPDVSADRGQAAVDNLSRKPLAAPASSRAARTSDNRPQALRIGL